MPRALRVWSVVWLAGCGSDIGVTQKALCDGQLQAAEATVDDVFDADGDGYFDGANPDCAATYAETALDCDDGDPDVNPGAAEVGCNGIDDDCSEATPDVEDRDGDGYDACADCDDTDSLVNPAATEVDCNGIDDDCDPVTLDEADNDGDGFSSCEDCDDTTGQLSPGNEEISCNGLDDDCSDATPDDPDGDGDGVGVCTDCDDTDSLVYPGAEEICDNEVDDNCSGEVDEECSADYTDVWVLDAPVAFTCGPGGAVTINASTVAIEDYYPAIRATMGAFQPGTMSGNFTGDTTFLATRNIAGLCVEDYELVGEFTSDTTLDATLTWTFTDSLGLGLCYDCTSGSVTFSASR